MAGSTWFTLHTMISRINIQTVTNFIFCTGELGFSLFEKKGRFLVLTKEGKEFLPYAMEVIESTKKAERSMNRIYQRHTGNIRFAYTRSIPPNYIPNLIRQFIEKYKDQDMPEMTLKRCTYLALRKDRQLGNAASEFLKFVRIYNKEYTIRLA